MNTKLKDEKSRNGESINGIPLLIIGAMFFGFQFIIRMSVGILREDIMSRYNVGVVEFGNLAGIYYLGYSIMQIPVGIMLDKFNLKYVAISFMSLAIFGSLVFIVSDSWAVILLARFIIGVGSAVGILFCVKIVNSFFREELRSFMVSLCVTFGLLCAIFGGAPMKIISDNFGYTKTFFILTLSGSLLILALIFTKIPQNKNNQDTTEFNKILKLIINPNILIMAICSGFMVGTFEGFADVWGMMFFNKVLGFSQNKSISLTSLILIGFACGTFVIFALERFIKDSTLILFSGLITCLIYAFLVFDNEISYSTLCVLMFIFGILCQYQIIVLNFVSKIVDYNYKTVTVSIVNCVNMMFGSFFHKIISYAMEMKWDGRVDEMGKNVYGSNAIVFGISTIPVFCFFGTLGFVYVIYKNKRNKYE